jgi:hypothetical protein
MSILKSIFGLLCFMLVIGPEVASAQDSLDARSAGVKWHFKVEPYLMFPNMSGQTGVAGLPLADVDASASDIFSKLQMGFMLNVDAGNGTWAVNSDFLYMNLKQELSASTLINSGKVNAKQMGWEVSGFRRVAPWLEFGIGGLLNSIELDLNVTQNQVGGGTISKSGNQSKTWLDPMLISRFSTTGNGKIYGQLRAELGGFGIGSDFAWQIQGIAGYRFSKLFDMSLGYRAISLDYKDGDGPKAFVYDVTTFGPMVRFGFSF